MTESKIIEALTTAVREHQRGQVATAEAIYQRILLLDPSCVDALHYLGVVALQTGQYELAVIRIERAARLTPDVAAIQSNLGESLRKSKRITGAIGCLRRAVSLRADFADAWCNLGAALISPGPIQEAIFCLKRAVELNPTLADAYNNLGNALKETNRTREAITSYLRTTKCRPDSYGAFYNIGKVYHGHQQYDNAFGAYVCAVTLCPEFADAYDSMGTLQRDLSRREEAENSLRRALKLSPDRASTHSNLIMTLLLRDDGLSDAVASELDRWNLSHARSLSKVTSSHKNDSAPDRRLRVGYVSADFRMHPVGLNLLPLFRHHDHQLFEIFSYAQVEQPDDVTRLFRARSDQWRDIIPLGDMQLADQIRNDRIDILVDLSLHTAGNRLLVFARKPAPVQISFAGYPGKTGLATIDYYLTDHFLEPRSTREGNELGSAIRLSNTYWCIEPRADHLPVNPLPALAAGQLTFGCLNNFCKVNEATLLLWAEVMLAVPKSHIILLAPEGSARRRVVTVFAQAGITEERINFFGRLPRDEYLSLHNRIDLILDTFPYNGHTTSLDAYWMGVPVVTLVGKSSVSRAGWSHLNNLGLTELAATNETEFVSIAASLARDLSRLAALRSDLRQRMQRSPLMDGSGFARAIERVYRESWNRRLAANPQQSANL